MLVLLAHPKFLDTYEELFGHNQKAKEGIEELRQISQLVRAAGYGTKRIRIDVSVVRGLEYYTGPVFEAELLFDVTNEKGEKVGIMSPSQALTLAEQAGLDLVEISPGTQPPVCKILDYGKYKYQAQKKANEARKKQKTIEIKEIKIRPNIDTHDYGVKMKSIQRFFEEGDKVKVTLRFRGREMAHQDIGYRLLERVKAETATVAKVESEPQLEGRQMIMILAPR